MRKDKHGEKKFCPLIEDTYDGCYCSILNSSTIGDAIYYCGGHFEECKIYKKIMENSKNKTVIQG